MYGGGDDDHLRGEGGDDWLYGGDNNDSISGDEGQDRLFGDDGGDTLEGGADGDFIDGGEGFDFVSYVRSDAAVSINLAKNMASGGDATGDRLFNIEGVYGTQYDDVIVGDDNANSLFGARGVDEIRGGGGDDVIVGGTNPLAGKVEGDEPLLPFEVGDQLWGDGGDDSFRFDLGDSGGLKDNGILLSGPDQRGIDTIHDFDLNGDDTLVFELNPRYRAVWDAEHVAIAGTPIIGTFVTVREFHRVYSEPGDSYEVFLQNTPKHMIDGDDFEFWSIPY